MHSSKKKKAAGASKVRAGNRALFAALPEAERKRLASQNAYRRAVGLPEIKSA